MAHHRNTVTFTNLFLTHLFSLLFFDATHCIYLIWLLNVLTSLKDLIVWFKWKHSSSFGII